MNDVLPYQEEELIRRFRAGDENAFTEVYDRFYFNIYQYAKRWLMVAQDAQDVTAETFIKLLERRAQFVSMGNISAFLRLTVRNACFDQLKHKRVKTGKWEDLLYQLSREQEPDFDWIEVQEVYLTMIYAEVERLPEKMKEIFLLSYRDGLKPAEIARKLGLKVRTVSNQKTNAIRLLRTALDHTPLLIALLAVLESEYIRL